MFTRSHILFPSVLIIHCNRGSDEDTSVKLKHRVIIPRFQQLSHPSMNGNIRYELSSIVTHHGLSAISGHYTCAVRNQSRWILYNDAKVTEIHTSNYNTSEEAEENIFHAIYSSCMNDAFVDKISNNQPNCTGTEFSFVGLPDNLETKIQGSKLKPHSKFQLLESDMESLLSGDWFDSRIIVAYMELLETPLSSVGRKVKCFDPLLIPILKANGFESVSTFSNGANI